MKDIVIIGAGGFGRETAWLLRQINERERTWDVKGYYDDRRTGVIGDGLRVLGTVKDLNKVHTSLAVVIAIADPFIRKEIVERLSPAHLYYPTLFHPKADRGDNSSLYGKGCIVTNACILTVNVKVKDFVIINLGTSVGHDVAIGSYSSIMPDCSISGFVTIGDECAIGAGARILPGISIGNRSVVGAGAVVTKDFGERAKLIGVPAINIAEHVERI